MYAVAVQTWVFLARGVVALGGCADLWTGIEVTERRMMTALWKKLLKKVAGKAFTWGLKKLTELSPESVASTPAPRKPRTRKPYAH